MRSTRWLWAPIVALACLTGCASYKSAGPAAAPLPSQADYRYEMDGQDMTRRLEEPAMNAQAAPPSPDRGTAASGADVVAAEVMVVSRSAGEEMYAGPSGGVAKEAAPPPAPPPPPPPPPTPGDAGKGKPEVRGPVEQAAPGSGEVAVARQPMLIYTAGLRVMVDEVKASMARIEAMTRELGGFLARRDDASITIRVPANRFDEALARVTALGEVLQRKVTVDDVTEEYLDLEVRLQNLRAIRARLEKLLERATKVEEAVLLERELARVAGEMERIEGRMKLLRDQSAFSTITVSLTARRREDVNRAAPRLPVSWLDELGLGRLLRL